MTNQTDLRAIARNRLKTAKTLITSRDWDGAGLMMGYALECALKAAICKTLHLTSYPERTGKEHDNFFLTHNFDRLLRLSGLENLFGVNGIGGGVWSNFTQDYHGEWIAMRYETTKFDETRVRVLYNCLTAKIAGSEGIFTILNKARKW